MRLASASCFLRTAGMLLTCAILHASGQPSNVTVTVDSSLPGKKKSDQPVAVLAPKLEAKLKEFIDKAEVEKGKVLDARMKTEIDDIAKVTGLNDAGQQTLATLAKHTVETCTADWGAKLTNMIRAQLTLQPPEQAALMFDQMQSQVAMIAQVEFPFGSVQPTEQDDWIKAVHATLSPEQAAAWDKAQTERKQDLEKQMGVILKNSITRTHDQFQQELFAKSQDIELTLGLDKARADKLDDLAKTVVDQSTEAWQKRAENVLLAMDDAQRAQITRNGNFFIEPQSTDLPSQQAAWKEGVAHLLTADETKRLQTVKDERKNKRVEVMGQLMIMLLDEKLAFTATQRQQLQPIANRLVKDVTSLYPDGGAATYFSYSPGLFVAAGAKATDAELKPILDNAQLNHWRQITKPEDVAETPPDAAKSSPGEHLEPEDVERLISEFLYRKTAEERKRLLAANVLKVEDIVRTAGLSSEAATRLQAATRGTTEESLTRWKWFVEQQVRGQLQEVTPQNVRQRLDSIQDFFFQQNYGIDATGPTIWDRTVKTELSAKQQETWQKETDERAAFRDQAIAALVMTEFDRRNPLSPGQWDKLQPLVAGVIRDYSPDISRIFSPSNPVPWYMEGFYVLLPFVGIPDTDLQAILTKNQQDIWTKSQEHANAGNFWQNIKQFHDQRVKTK